METRLELKGLCSTVSVMEYIRDNGFKANYNGDMHFWFPEDTANYRFFGKQPRSIIVSEQDTHCWFFPKLHPLDEWHDVFGMKRYAIGERQWYAYINEQFYYMSSF